MEDFFHFISRFVIVVPIIVVVAAIFIKFGSPDYKSYSVSLPTPTAKLAVSSANTNIKIDLKGPFICKFSSKDATISAFIKDKKISTKFVEKNLAQNYLLKDDCLYIWNEGSFSGEKTCGLTNYVNLAESLISSNLLDINTIFNYLNKFGETPSLMKNPVDLKNLLNSCKKEEITDVKIFELPNNVLFKNTGVK